MAYLGTEDLKKLLPDCIEGYDEKRIDNVAYELSLGDEVYLTDSTTGKKEILDHKNSQVVIKPGQFALLLTQEKVTIPIKILAFISIKFSQKIKGLVNISGFHVDPGFEGKIIFSVYNAGPATIVMDKGKPYFMIWFSNLTGDSEPYDGKHKNQSSITAEHISQLKGELASPNSLLTQIKELEKKVDIKVEELKGKKDYNKWILQGIAILLFGLLIKSCNDYDSLKKGYEYGTANKSVKDEVKAVNIDSIVTFKIDSILNKRINQNDTTKK